MELHTIRHGDGPIRFVLVHGLASNARMWDGVGAELAARGVASVAVDLRGHGRSPKPDDGYDHATIVEDLLPLLDDRPVLAGQSWGGAVVVEAAVRHPGLVSGVVCVDGGAWDLKTRFASWDECREALAPPVMEGRPLAEIEGWMREHRDWPESGLAGMLANFEVRDDGTVKPWLDRAHHFRVMRSMWEYTPSAMWPRVQAPVLFLTASMHHREGVDAALAALPDARAVWFEGADHDVHAQKPTAVATHLLGML